MTETLKQQLKRIIQTTPARQAQAASPTVTLGNIQTHAVRTDNLYRATLPPSIANTDFFILKDDSVQVSHRRQITANLTAATTTEITYEQFYDVLTQNRASIGGDTHEMYRELCRAFPGNTVILPPHLFGLKKQGTSYVVQQIYGGSTYLFPSIQADTTIAKITFLLDADKRIVPESIHAERFTGIFTNRKYRQASATPLPALSAFYRELFGGRVIRNFNEVCIAELSRQVTERTIVNYPQIQDVIGTQNPVAWEEI